MTTHLQPTNPDNPVRSLSGNFLNAPKIQIIHSNSELIDRIEAFINKIRMGQNGRFICIVGSDSNHKTICINFKGNHDEIILNQTGMSVFNFNFQEIFYINTIYDGALDRTTPPQHRQQNSSFVQYQKYTSNSQNHLYKIELPNDDRSFQAILRFPGYVSNKTTDIKTPLENRILDMMTKKLDSLNKKIIDQQVIKNYATAFLSAMLAAYLLNIYLIATSSD